MELRDIIASVVDIVIAWYLIDLVLTEGYLQ